MQDSIEVEIKASDDILVDFPGFCSFETLKQKITNRGDVFVFKHLGMELEAKKQNNINLLLTVEGTDIKCKTLSSTVHFNHLIDYQMEFSDQTFNDLKNQNFGEIYSLKPQKSHLHPPPYFSKSKWSFENQYKDSVVAEKELLHVFTCDLNAARVPLRNPKLPESIPIELQDIVEQTRAILDSQPIWIFNELFSKISNEMNVKFISRALAYTTYRFFKGPFRKCRIKFGIDPRSDYKYRKYQVLSIKYNNTWIRTLLCDVDDPEFQNLVNSRVYCKTTFDSQNGFFIDGHLDLLREKYKIILKAGSMDGDNEAHNENENDENYNEEEEDDGEEEDTANIEKILTGLEDEDEFDLLFE